jgi:amino acid adenylation domain-containing protein
MVVKNDRQSISTDEGIEFSKEELNHSIARRFEKVVSKYPNHIAIKVGESGLTYDQLNGIANQIAHRILKEHSNQQQRIALLFEHGPDMIASMIGTLKSGNLYVPLDANYPCKRLEYILEDSQSTFIVTNEKNVELAQNIISGSHHKPYLINIDLIPTATSDQNVNLDLGADHLAYLLYTSGSTGLPKGVIQSHRNVLHFIRNYTHQLQVDSRSRVSLLSSFSSDAAVMDVYSALLNGATLIPFNVKEEGSLIALTNWVSDERISIWHSTPTLYRYFTSDRPQFKDFKDLRYIVLGGESITPNDLLRLNSFSPKTMLVNLYGQSESSFNSLQFFTPGSNEGKITLGEVVDDTDILLLKEDGEEADVFETAEIYICSEYLSPGYWGKSDLSKEVFIDDHPVFEGRFYRTGDMGRLLSDGRIQFVGRKDFQVKISGFRVEVGEIENKLIANSHIQECVVVALDNKQSEKYLCAYIVADQEMTVEELRSHLSQTLPDYMIPSSFVQLKKLPLTPSGKIDRLALPEQDGSLATGTEYVAPRNEVEEKLARLWSDVLGVEKIGVKDNFFTLGGHSLKATMMVSKLYKIMGVDVPLRELFQAPTIQDLATYIQSIERGEYISIEVVEKRAYYPVSSAQKRLYILQQFEEGTISYNMPNALKMKGILDKERLENAFKALIQRHDSLRTSFDMVKGEPVQRVHQEVDFTITYREAGEGEIEQIISAFIRPFDLSQAPLLRVEMVRVAEDCHIFLLDMHHIICDGVSINLVVRDLMSFYEEKELPILEIQYKDFSVWENNLLTTDKIKKMEAYWKESFREEIPILELPTDYSRPAVNDAAGDRIDFTVEREKVSQLQVIAKQNGATLYMVLLAAYNVLLSRYSGQEDIVVGSTISGRGHADLEHIVGMFVNTVVLRNRPISTLSFESFLAEVKDQALQVYEHQDYPFELLVENLNVERDTSRSPLFDVMFVLQNMELAIFEIEGLTLSSYKFTRPIAKFDLTLAVMETESGLRCSLEYRTSLFKRETIYRLADHFTQIIDQITKQPNTLIKEIDMLTAIEKQQLLVDFNYTKTMYPRDKTIQQLFEEQVERTPYDVALVFEEEQLTYRELNDKANQLARVLRSKGIQADKIVGIMVDRSFEMIIGIFGILKTGGAYLPIDPTLPAERIQYMLEDSQASLLLTQQHLSRIEMGGEMIALDDENLYTGNHSNIGIVNGARDLAYVIYTSGSTGNPKGVMVEQQALVNYIEWAKEQYLDMGNSDFPLFTSLSFDLTITSLFTPLTSGNKIVIYKEDRPEILIEEIMNQGRVGIVKLTPSHLKLVKHMNLNHSSVKRFIVGGEELTKELAKEIQMKFNDEIEIINEYGPTETTVGCTHYRFSVGRDHRLSVPVGTPANNVQIYILDRSLKPVAKNVLGEIYISGDGLARGYLNRPELTAEKFVENPFLTGERMYKTGDLARWLSDGNVEYVGRVDHQVKIRGHRIEQGEIEDHLLKHVNINESLVVERFDAQGDSYLCAYLVADKELAIEVLRNHLSQSLPEYMIPTSFVQLKEMPLTPNGKIDRKALPEPDGKLFTETEYVAPGSVVEEKVVQIWQEVLKVEGIGIKHGFFELGGHSLKAIKMMSRINEEFGIAINLGDIFQNPTVYGMSQLIEKKEIQNDTGIEAVSKQDYYELSHAHKRIWFAHQLNPNSSAYNISSCIILSEKYDEALVKKVFEALLNRHESLRTRFKIVNGNPVQLVPNECNVDIEAVDLTKLEGDETEILLHIKKEFTTPFHLEASPLVRVKAFIYNENKFYLSMVVHHIIFDGWSSEIIKREFHQLYEAYKKGEEVKLDPLKIQYKDFSNWQNQFIATGKMEEHRKYWYSKLGGELPVLKLPKYVSYAESSSRNMASFKFSIDHGDRENLMEMTKVYRATLFTILLTSFKIFLSRLTGQRDIIVGTPSSGRENQHLENIVGCFINTTMLRSKIEPENRFDEQLEIVQKDVIESLKYQSYPFDLLVNELNIKRELDQFPISSVFFNMINFIDPIDKHDNFDVPVHEQLDNDGKFDLNYYIEDNGKSILVDCRYNTAMFQKDRIEYLNLEFRKLLKFITTQPTAVIKDIEIFNKTSSSKRRRRALNKG